MSKTTAEAILHRISGWGVERVYGYPGDGINGLMAAWRGLRSPQLIQTRHEEIAAFAATAHAKFTGEVGVCMATSGPGAIHLLNGLYDAKLDHQPVVAIVGQQARMSLGSDYQQEVDLQNLFKDVASAYVQTCNVPEQVPHLIDRAFRIAKATRSPTCVIVPNDVQELPAAEPPRSHGAVFSSAAPAAPQRLVPGDEQLRQAAELLNAGTKVAILVGQGAKGAAAELEELADRLGAGVAKALNGRAVLPDDLPYVTGSIGLLGTRPSYELMMDCDTFLMIGSSFPYSEWLPKPGQARGVQIDLDARVIGMRYPTEINLVGDAAQTIRALLPMLARKDDRSWQETVAENVERWWQVLDARAMEDADPINPQRVLHELSPRLPDRVILTADSGSATNWWARYLRIRPGMDAALSGGLATMCPAVPYALAAKLAHPDRPVVAVVGDGAMQMLGNAALIDLAFHRHRWQDQRLVVCVLNNRDLNQVTWEQRAMSGSPKFETSQVLPAFDFAGYAQLIGLEGIRVDRPEDVGTAWDRALSADRPTVLDVVTDPEIPPLPPHIDTAQAESLTKALLGRDPASGRIIVNAFRGKVKEFTNR